MNETNACVRQEENKQKTILVYYKRSNDSGLDVKERVESAHKFLTLLKLKNVDSLLPKAYLLLCKLKSKQKQLDSALVYSKKVIEYGKSNKDTSLLVKGYFRKGFYEKKLLKNLEAFKSYNIGIQFAIKSKDSLSVSNMLINVANIQNELGDFYGAQISAVKGLNYANNNTAITYQLYNALSISFSNSKDYKNAQEVYEKLIKITSSPIKKAIVLNNLGNNYRKQHNYEKAVSVFYQALKDSININNSKTIARLKDNLGFTLFEWHGNKGLSLMKEALKTRKHLKDYSGQFASYIHLVNYNVKKNSNKALNYSRNAFFVAKKINSPDAQLEALSYIILLKPTKKETAEYVYLNDSINTAKSLNQNKYAGVIFKTKEKEKENLQLKANNVEQELQLEKENKRKWYFGIGLVTALITLGVFMFYYRRNKKQKTIIENLQKDLHHRVKNNLAIIDALIDDIKDEFDNEKFKTKLTELQNRIDSINEVHSQLYLNTDITNLKLKKYVNKLAKNVQQSFAKDNIVINQDIKDSLQLKVDKSFPVGLIINEFLTNSFKYAFDDNDKGIISISIKEKPKTFLLTLSDNGKGLPNDFDISKLDSFGVDVMKLLSKQLKGTFLLDGLNGVNLNIEFPKR
ncbi:hypothetical protein JYU05_00230 [bacterium AH-315-P13]|nr:hypothetical protein [bacterium AH-315-P13]